MTDLKFDIVSVKIINNFESKKYVAYKMVIKRGANDLEPASLERRYTDFRRLYEGLRASDSASVVEAVHFPGKALIGNLGEALMASRANAFIHLMCVASSNSSSRTSRPFIHFLLQDLEQVLLLLRNHLYEAAKPVVENTFRAISKMLTARSPAVLLTLCLLVAINAQSGDPAARPLAALALRRFQGVSDVDLLRYYVPLLHTAQDIAGNDGNEAAVIADHLETLRVHGMDTRTSQPLLSMLMLNMEQHGASAFYLD